MISFGGEPISTNSPQTAIPFGKYVLIKRLAVGGMAELFLAQQPPNAGLVVLKRILPYLSEEPEFVQMFLDEAKIAAQLHHPNIVQVHELGKLDNTIFIAMEFVEGIDLRRVVQEESKFGATVPYGVAAAICAQVAAGLDYAHNSVAVDGRPLELIHRDVSPQNVMIAYDGRVKIVDFGIAKAGAFIEARSKPGVIKGKFLYLSPEQVAQLKLDHRADIFALGTMMYEITTGKSPFAKPTTEGILYAIRSEDPSPPHLIKDDYPQELSRIIMRCLVKDRDLRYQRAAEVQEDLEALIESGALKQSTDISEYIARLMGEEEERTVLHIPVAAPTGRKDATQAMPAGLTTRPLRRPTGEGAAAPPDYGNEPEVPTQMSRPGDMLSTKPERLPERAVVVDEAEQFEAEAREAEDDEEARSIERAVDEARDFEDEPEESTAIGTIPAGFHRPASAQATIAQRGRGRANSTPAAAPATPPPRRPSPSVSREPEPRGDPRARRPHTGPARRPLVEEEEASQSISLTQPTLNQRALRGQGDETEESISQTPATVSQRPVSRQFVRPAPVREEDSVVDTESGMGEVSNTDASPAFVDPEDDESTAGYESETEAPVPRSGKGVMLIVVAAVLVILVLGGAWWALSSSSNAPSEDFGPPPAVRMTDPNAPPDTATQAPPPTPTPAPEAVAVAPPAAEPSTAPAPAETAPANPTGETAAPPTAPAPGGEPATPATVAAANTDTNPGTNPETVPPQTAEPQPPAPVEPDGVPVKFKTTSTTATIWVNGKKIEPNKVFNLPAGSIRVRFVCSTHKRPNKGSFVQTLKEGATEPREFSIPCRKGQR